MMNQVSKHMRKLAIAAACGLGLSTGAQAANLAFAHTDAADFRDLRATDQSQPRFEERVLKDIGEHFQKEAAALPAGQTLHVTVTDLDLAGFIEYPNPMRFPLGLRVIRNVDFPQMKFTYELRDASGAVLQAGEEKLSGMRNFRLSTRIGNDNSALSYEKLMISDWFDRTFGS